MEYYHAVSSRRSIRKYRPDPVPPQALHRIFEAVREAPSAKNIQPWKFILVKDPENRKRLVEACNKQAFLAEAPLVVVACGWPAQAYHRMGGSLSSLPIDLGIAMEHLVLAATAEGLGTCWIGAFTESAVKEILQVPPEASVVALTPLGLPADVPAPRPRKPLAEIVAWETWDGKPGLAH